MDLITHLPISEEFVLVSIIIARFSKYVTFTGCKAICIATDLARMFYNYIVHKFGMLQKIVSNRDSEFLSKFW